VIYQQSFLSIRKTCSHCGGSGKIIRQPCAQCRGQGAVRVERRIKKVNVPAGVDSALTCACRRKDRPESTARRPAICTSCSRSRSIRSSCATAATFTARSPVNIAQAALGAEIQIPTLEEPQSLTIPRRDAARGRSSRLRNLGIPRVNAGGRGDLHVHIEVRIPAKLTRQQRQLLESLSEQLPADNQPREKGLFDKVKDYFV